MTERTRIKIPGFCDHPIFSRKKNLQNSVWNTLLLLVVMDPRIMASFKIPDSRTGWWSNQVWKTLRISGHAYCRLNAKEVSKMLYPSHGDRPNNVIDPIINLQLKNHWNPPNFWLFSMVLACFSIVWLYHITRSVLQKPYKNSGSSVHEGSVPALGVHAATLFAADLAPWRCSRRNSSEESWCG